MSKYIKFSENIFSEKEMRDFKRREKVAAMLGVGESWKKIKEETGAHLQTIAIISKRLKLLKNNIAFKGVRANKKAGPIFVFGQGYN